MQYSDELKDSLLRRMLPLGNESITKISREEGISEQTLRNWRDKAGSDGIVAPGIRATSDGWWSTQDKFLIVVETASMSETELAEYARKKGFYAEQIKAWKDACMNDNGGVAEEAARVNKELKATARTNKQLQKELDHKEKALAETAALFVLRKKAEYADMSPCEIFPALADEGRFIASESTFYRVLHEEKMQNYRGRSDVPYH